MSNEEWVESRSDIDGFWDGEGVVQFIPVGYKSFPSKKYRGRITRFVFGKATAETSATDKDGETITVNPGETIGVWYSAGMSDLMNLAGTKVRMKRDETLDKVVTGGTMKGFRIQHVKGSSLKPLPNLTTASAPQDAKGAEPTEEPSMDDLPF